MSKIGEPKVRFLSLSSLQTGRSGFLLAKSALFTLLSLLFVADSGTRQRAIAFFSSLYPFCHLADLRFRSFSSAARIKRVLRRQQNLSADADPLSSNILALLLDASTVGTQAEDLSPATGIPAAVLKHSTTARELRRGACAAVALVAAKKCSVSDKDVVKTRA
jgi:hypothetical protein